MDNQNIQNTDLDLMTIDEVAKFLRVNKQVIYYHINHNEMPVTVLTKRTRFIKRDMLYDWINRRSGFYPKNKGGD